VTSCSPVVHRRFGTYCLHFQDRRYAMQVTNEPSQLADCFLRVAFSLSSTLKTEAVHSSDASANFRRITRYRIPKDSSPHSLRCGHLKPKININCTPPPSSNLAMDLKFNPFLALCTSTLQMKEACPSEALALTQMTERCLNQKTNQIYS
jgi:hypothetical protein